MSSSASRLVALALGLAACTGGSSFPPTDMSFEQFCPAWQAAVAALYARCDNVPADGLNQQPCASLAARQAAGRMAFDRSRAAACLRNWQTASCDMLHKGDFYACNDVLFGTVDKGGACANGFECAGDLYCDFSAGVCPGRCADPLADGAACDGAMPPPCISGTSCVSGADGAHCRALVGPGGACGPGVADCRADLGCASAPDGGSGATCQPALRDGDGCAAAGDVCPSYAPCAASGVCALAPIVPAGSPCTADTRCAAGTACVAGACLDCSGAF